MNNYDEYLKKGDDMVHDGVIDGILEIEDKKLRDAMLKYWSGELTFEENVDFVAYDFNKRVENEIIRLMFKELLNKDRFNIYVNEIN